MKHISNIIGIAILLFSLDGFSQVPKKIMVEHFTNTKCGTCASRNPGFYSNFNNQQGALYLAVHPSSPYNTCLLYQQNAAANDERTNFYGIYGSTPRLVINRDVIPATADYSSSSIFDPYQSLISPASIRIVQEKFAADSIRAAVIIKTESDHSSVPLSLFVALAEDTVFFDGGNGEPLHFNVFRKALTSTSGIPVTLPLLIGDSVTFSFSAPANSIWNFSRIFTLAVLQETSSKETIQAEAVPASAGASPLGIADHDRSVEPSVFPNPADKLINVQLSGSSSAMFLLYDVQGKPVMQKRVSQNNFQVDISSIPSGIYLLNIKVGKEDYIRKIVKK